MKWRGIGVVLTAGMLAAVGCGGGSEAPPAEPAGQAEVSPDTAAPPTATGSQGSASITGTVTYEGQVPTLKPVAMDADPACASKHGGKQVVPEVLVLGDGQTLGNVFVRVKGGLAQGSWPAPTEPAVIDQQGCVYVPHVLGVMVDQPIKILNSDGLLHNIHALPKVNQPFNMAMPANRTEAEQRFSKEEFMVPMKCDVHPWMSGFVGVSSHPFFDVTEKDGRYEIRNLPAGTYEIELWHERLGTKSATVTVGDGESATSDAVFTRS
jgi:hypothetical protein